MRGFYGKTFKFAIAGAIGGMSPRVVAQSE
jgi:hypothetical protein